MTRRILYAVIIALWALCAAQGAAADDVYLSNGDHLSGRLISIANGTLVLRTDYAGDISLPLQHVAALQTSQPLRFGFSDGVEATGMLHRVDGATVFEGEDVQRAVTPPELVSAAPLAALEAAPVPPALPAVSEPEKERKWHGGVEAGATWRSGETNAADASMGLNLNRTWNEKHTLNLDASGTYGEVEAEINARRAKGQAKWQYYPRERTYLYTLGGLEHDAARKLELRANTALGAGYDILKGETRKLSVDLGLDFAREWWSLYGLSDEEAARAAARDAIETRVQSYLVELAGTPPSWAVVPATARMVHDVRALQVRDEIDQQDDWNLRASSKFQQTLFQKSVISQDLTFLPNVDDLETYRVMSDLGLTTPLSESLNLRLSLKSEYDSNPGDGGDVQNWDNTLITSIQYGF